MRNRSPRVTVRRIDQAHRVVVTVDGLEHTHQNALSQRKAWRLAQTIRSAMRDGHDLNLAYWDTEPI